MRDSSTVKSFKQGIAKGLGFGVGASIALATTTLLAAAAAMKVFSAGEVISADQLNRNFTIASPELEISAFYRSDCPEGWAVADGTNGTPDLRGRFIRGMDNMGVGAANVDPQSALRTLGHEQMDAFQGHRHRSKSLTGWGADPWDSPLLGRNQGGTSDSFAYSVSSDGEHGDPRTSSETRPRNVALIYCMRKN